MDEDDATDAPTWYADGDDDGYGVESDTAVACTAPSGYIVSSSDTKFVGEGSLDFAGRSVSGGGDVDGDGFGDLLVGAPEEGEGGTYAGAAYLILWADMP